MIEVEETKDHDYIKGVLSKPGMAYLCGDGTNPPINVDCAIRNPNNRFVLVLEDGIRKGFVIFTCVPETSISLIHVALYTRGNKTVEAITKAMDFARKHFRVKDIWAVYTEGRRAIAHLCEKIGFSAPDKLMYYGVIHSIRVHQSE